MEELEEEEYRQEGEVGGATSCKKPSPNVTTSIRVFGVIVITAHTLGQWLVGAKRSANHSSLVSVVGGAQGWKRQLRPVTLACPFVRKQVYLLQIFNLSKLDVITSEARRADQRTGQRTCCLTEDQMDWEEQSGAFWVLTVTELFQLASLRHTGENSRRATALNWK